MLNETLAQIERTGEKADYAEILRLKGEVLWCTRVERPRSRALPSRGTRSCPRAGGHMVELRSSVSLARVLRDNRSDEVRAMLAKIYNWFTEGFDTAD